MCMSCGCGDVTNDHGNPDNITLNQMQKAAGAAKINIEQAANNIQHAARQYRDRNQAAARATEPRPASASGAGGRPGDTLAGGNYRAGDMIGTTSGDPGTSGLTGTAPSIHGMGETASTEAVDRAGALADTGPDTA